MQISSSAPLDGAKVRGQFLDTSQYPHRTYEVFVKADPNGAYLHAATGFHYTLVRRYV